MTSFQLGVLIRDLDKAWQKAFNKMADTRERQAVLAGLEQAITAIESIIEAG